MNRNDPTQLNSLIEIESQETFVLAGFFTPGTMMPVRRICENLGIDRKWQQQRIQSDPKLSQLGGMFKCVAMDGKMYDTYCLSPLGLQEWLWGIEPSAKCNYSLLEQYRKFLLADIQTKLMMMFKVTLEEVIHLRAQNSLKDERLRIAQDLMDAEEEGRELTRQAKEKFKQAKDLKQEFVELQANPNQLQLF